jgi:autotransporter-associated beta strand protein
MNDSAGVAKMMNVKMMTCLIVFSLIGKASLAGDAVWKGSVSGVWDGGALNWTVDGTPDQVFTDGDSVTFDDSASSFSITTVGTVSPSSVLVSNTTLYTFTEVTIGGTGQLVKAGAGTLVIPRDTPATNTYSGGTVVNGGTLDFAWDHPLGHPAAPLSVNGATLNLGNRAWTSTRPVFLTGDNIFRTAGNGHWTCAGPVSGTGGFLVRSIPNGGNGLTLSSTSNSFTGELGIDSSGQGLSVNLSSLADSLSPGTGNIYFMPSVNSGTLTWRSDATNALILNNRRLEFRGDGVMSGQRVYNDNSSYPIVLNADLLVSGSGSKTFTFDMRYTGLANAFAGAITEGTSGATVSLIKSGSGSLLLSGMNSYSGTVTVSGGTLITEGEFALPEEGTLNLDGGTLTINDRWEVVTTLQFNGTNQLSGRWGSSLSLAEYTDDSRFSGDGMLYVGLPRPPKGTLIILR